MLQSFSVYNIPPSANSFNVTLNACISEVERVKISHRADEASLQYMQENLECALEKYGKKIEKKVHEDQWSLMERTYKIFMFFRSSDKNTTQEEQTIYDRKLVIL